MQIFFINSLDIMLKQLFRSKRSLKSKQNMAFLILGLFVSIVMVNAGIHTNDYYISYPEKVNWFAALRFCTYHGMYLIDIPTDLEYKNIENVIASNNSTALGMIWTSGTRLGTKHGYYWATSGHAFVYANWAPSQPNDTPTEKCLLLWDTQNFKFADYGCESEQTFICRKKYIEPQLISVIKQCKRIESAECE